MRNLMNMEKEIAFILMMICAVVSVGCFVVSIWNANALYNAIWGGLAAFLMMMWYHTAKKEEEEK